MRVFLLTSFPSLSFNAPPPLSMDAVLSRCGDHLSSAEMQEMEALSSTPPEGTSAFAMEWFQVWSSIHTWNQKNRLAAISADSDQSITVPDSQVRRNLIEAWEESDPLKRETAVLHTEWDWLERQRRAAPYSKDDLYGYILQTQLLERKDRWQEQAGLTQFQSHVASFLDPVLDDLQETHV